MPIASGIAKQVRYKKEATFGVAPGATLAQLLRRVESNLNLEKDTYSSNELRSDYQISDFRHGMRKSNGTIKGEFSAKTYADFIGSALRRDFAAVTPVTGASVTIALGSLVNGVQQYTITRAAGSFLTDGVKSGDVVRLSVGTLNVANINKNFFVISLTATVLTGIPLNGVAMVAEGPIASTTITVIGKKTFVPTTGHTDQSYAIEHWFADAALSELYLGCKVSSLDISLPPSGMATIDVGLMGAGGLTTNTSAYYTSPAALTTTGIMAAVNGVRSNSMPAIFPGRVNVTGQFSAYFENATFRDYFLNETEVGLSIALTADNSATSDVLSITMPRIKLGSASRSDGEKGIVVTADFQALFNGAGGAGATSEQTTISIQDSAA
jgi:hypothetical protein